MALMGNPTGKHAADGPCDRHVLQQKSAGPLVGPQAAKVPLQPVLAWEREARLNVKRFIYPCLHLPAPCLPLSTNTCKNHRLRHLCSGFGAKIAICDTCAQFVSICYGKWTSICYGKWTSICYGQWTSICYGKWPSICYSKWTSICYGK